MQLRILNKKEISRILSKLNEQFEINLKIDYGMLRNKDGKIFLVTKDLGKVNLDKLRINDIGLYAIREDKEIRLSIEGSQLFGKHVRKNIYEINKDEANLWMTGNNIKCNKVYNGFVIIKYEDNFLGTGKYKNNEIINYVPKERWIKQHSINKNRII